MVNALPKQDIDTDAHHIYGQTDLAVTDLATITARLGYDSVNLGVTSTSIFTPGLGLVLRPSNDLTLRMAANRSLKRPVIIDQSPF
jgi:outer membrane receptor protein involved in Fe transport